MRTARIALGIVVLVALGLPPGRLAADVTASPPAKTPGGKAPPIRLPHLHGMTHSALHIGHPIIFPNTPLAPLRRPTRVPMKTLRNDGGANR